MNISTNSTRSSVSPLALLLTLVLLVALSLPMRRAKAEPKPQGATVVCLVVAAGVGTILVWGLWKICDRAFPTPTNAVTNSPPGTNSPVKSADGDAPLWVTFRLAIESSTNLTAWTVDGYMNGAIDAERAVFVTTDPAGIPLLTNSGPLATMLDGGQLSWLATNDVRSVIHENPGEPKRFWRLRND